jgi:hypothetical protein
MKDWSLPVTAVNISACRVGFPEGRVAYFPPLITRGCCFQDNRNLALFVFVQCLKSADSEHNVDISLFSHPSRWTVIHSTLQKFIRLFLQLVLSHPGLENRDYGRGDPLRWPRDTHYQIKLALTSPEGCGRSVGIVRLRTKTREFSCFFLVLSHSPR